MSIKGFTSFAGAGCLLALVAPANAQTTPEPNSAGEDDDVVVSASAGPTSPSQPSLNVVTAPVTTTATLEELQREILALRKRIDDLESNARIEPPAGESVSLFEREIGAPIKKWLSANLGLSAIELGAYVQAQYEWHQDSEDQLLQGGQPLNQDRFLVRRGRVRLDAAWEWSALTIEIDGNTVRGPAFGVRRAEASVLWRGPWGPAPNDLRALRGDGPPPLMMLSVGLTEIPFGDEMTRSARDRVFMERSAGSLAFFPGEPDLGARLSGGVSFFRYSLAVMNGEPLDERNPSSGRDFNEAKDFVGRLGVVLDPTPIFHISAGISALRGEGFHPGSGGTKDALEWNDLNENGTVDPGEILGAPGQAPTKSQNFGRWAVGADLRLVFDTPIGKTSIYGELAIGQNMDRGFFNADPILTGLDVRELSAYGAVVQELSPYAFVGLRVDVYEPNADFFDTRGGELVPTSQVVRTISPVVGGGMPDLFRVILQYDNVHDGLARDRNGIPADLANDRFTARLQVSL